MFRKKLIAFMAAGIIGLAVGGNGIASAHEGHDHEGATDQASTAGTEDKVEKETCPVSGDKVDPKITYTYKGKVYRFCCASCAADFRKDPEKYIRKMNGEAAEAPMPHEDHDHD